MKIYKYIRCSTNEQDEALQDSIIQQYCFRNGIMPNEIFKDEVVSGGKRFTLKNFGLLCKKLSAGDCIIVSEISRIIRGGMSDLNDIIETYLKPNKLRFIICNVGIDIDCSNMDAITEKMLYIFAAAAEMEKEMIKAKIQSAMDCIKSEIEEFGYHISMGGNKKIEFDSGTKNEKSYRSEGVKIHQRALGNENNMKFYQYFVSFEERNGKFSLNDRNTNAMNWEKLADELNQLGYLTSTGLPFDSMRCRNTYRTLKKVLGNI